MRLPARPSRISPTRTPAVTSSPPRTSRSNGSYRAPSTSRSDSRADAVKIELKDFDVGRRPAEVVGTADVVQRFDNNLDGRVDLLEFQRAARARDTIYTYSARGGALSETPSVAKQVQDREIQRWLKLPHHKRRNRPRQRKPARVPKPGCRPRRFSMVRRWFPVDLLKTVPCQKRSSAAMPLPAKAHSPTVSRWNKSSLAMALKWLSAVSLKIPKCTRSCRTKRIPPSVAASMKTVQVSKSCMTRWHRRKPAGSTMRKVSTNCMTTLNYRNLERPVMISRQNNRCMKRHSRLKLKPAVLSQNLNNRKRFMVNSNCMQMSPDWAMKRLKYAEFHQSTTRISSKVAGQYHSK